MNFAPPSLVNPQLGANVMASQRIAASQFTLAACRRRKACLDCCEDLPRPPGILLQRCSCWLAMARSGLSWKRSPASLAWSRADSLYRPGRHHGGTRLVACERCVRADFTQRGVFLRASGSNVGGARVGGERHTGQPDNLSSRRCMALRFRSMMRQRSGRRLRDCWGSQASQLHGAGRAPACSGQLLDGSRRGAL